MSYQNPLHATLQPCQRSSYSSLSGAVPSSYHSISSTSGFKNSNAMLPRKRVPQTNYVPTAKWHHETGRVSPLRNAIYFNWIGQRGIGMPLRELCARVPHALNQMMEGANDQVMSLAATRRIVFHIRWPGYEHVEWTRTIEVATPQGPMTRAQLAGIISQHFARYLEKVQYEATRDIQWRIGPGGVKFEQIVLLSLVNVFENAWQAEVAIESC
ncbi:hypothetical protein PM082_007255 [Marasmius tenuissimus]|nr:hypothetical protein PM082_007255 [Marasmius tenuissimus]